MRWHLPNGPRGAPHLASGLLISGVLQRTDRPTMTNDEYYRETKWCAQCQGYVRFLMSVNHSFCVQCGGRVRLFSGDDDRQFLDGVQRHKWQAS